MNEKNTDILCCREFEKEKRGSLWKTLSAGGVNSCLTWRAEPVTEGAFIWPNAFLVNESGMILKYNLNLQPSNTL